MNGYHCLNCGEKLKQYEACLAVYGEDARLVRLVKKLTEAQKKVNRAHLKLATNPEGKHETQE